MSNFASHTPPPLRHPVPTHPAYIPEPPPTPVSPQGYQRYSSSPGPPPPQQQQQQHHAYASHHVPAYTSPFQHSQPPGPPPPPHQQQQQHHIPAPQPDFAAWGMNDATAQFGMQLGHSAVAAGQDYVQRNFGTIFPSTTLKHHFNVSNSYVIYKLKLVLFPWLHKPWARKVRRSEQGQATEWQSPREDLNSPDLYIPLMAFVTYILLCALLAGLQKQFHTKVLGEAASRALIVVILDLAFVKLGCYFLNVQGSSQVVDLIAYGGYKFVGVIFTLLASFLHFPSILNTLVFIYAFLANAFFLLRSLRSVVLPDPSLQLASNPNPTSTATLTSAARRRRITFLFLEAVCQVLYMGALVRI
ncbi:Protein transport protein yif1 [Hypsizygus marmoreus]|uniref:Protein YIF1 n=1 Tax=Hypsizygus marmoreus TaxID=39966 RepID=A0A369K812_HYPMA|nr:Protein transport protein yif1 [Hypsizygus marmoreus]